MALSITQWVKIWKKYHAKKKKDSDKKLFFKSVNFFVKILWSKQTLRIPVKNQ